ncbi:hypothetical protein DIPPA_05689 [Diplonema papillatum]|nr:hypothetical protein DIPPA_25668 [Diplonema papillatum]KAJ9437914.1 hypothetical protein DIPPA_35709 [Diplonema papillatum]KAJ9438195.1 hypothetical protein DIPPA_03921 [Diplonema papillatum]KAJ9438751.1 hypothetical protein DIPPA_29573 [Diplonema papillatum]KAJ9446835.1 hypothetical protein DIPPA_05689 [Diplonema papillatum]
MAITTLALIGWWLCTTPPDGSAFMWEDRRAMPDVGRLDSCAGLSKCAAGGHCREQNPWAVTTLALTGWWLCTTPPDGGDYDASRCDAPLGTFGGVSEVSIFRHGRGEEDGIVEFRCEGRPRLVDNPLIHVAHVLVPVVHVPEARGVPDLMSNPTSIADSPDSAKTFSFSTSFAATVSDVPVATCSVVVRVAAGPAVVPTTDAPPSAVPQTAAPAPCTSGGIQEFGNCYHTPAYAPAGCAAGVHCREQNPWAVTTLALTGWWLCTTPPDGGDYDASRCDAPLGTFGGVSEVNIFRGGEDGIVEFRCEGRPRLDDNPLPHVAHVLVPVVHVPEARGVPDLMNNPTSIADSPDSAKTFSFSTSFAATVSDVPVATCSVVVRVAAGPAVVPTTDAPSTAVPQYSQCLRARALVVCDPVVWQAHPRPPLFTLSDGPPQPPNLPTPADSVSKLSVHAEQASVMAHPPETAHPSPPGANGRYEHGHRGSFPAVGCREDRPRTRPSTITAADTVWSPQDQHCLVNAVDTPHLPCLPQPPRSVLRSQTARQRRLQRAADRRRGARALAIFLMWLDSPDTASTPTVVQGSQRSAIAPTLAAPIPTPASRPPSAPPAPPGPSLSLLPPTSVSQPAPALAPVITLIPTPTPHATTPAPCEQLPEGPDCDDKGLVPPSHTLTFWVRDPTGKHRHHTVCSAEVVGEFFALMAWFDPEVCWVALENRRIDLSSSFAANGISRDNTLTVMVRVLGGGGRGGGHSRFRGSKGSKTAVPSSTSSSETRAFPGGMEGRTGEKGDTKGRKGEKGGKDSGKRGLIWSDGEDARDGLYPGWETPEARFRVTIPIQDVPWSDVQEHRHATARYHLHQSVGRQHINGIWDVTAERELTKSRTITFVRAVFAVPEDRAESVLKSSGFDTAFFEPLGHDAKYRIIYIGTGTIPGAMRVASHIPDLHVGLSYCRGDLGIRVKVEDFKRAKALLPPQPPPVGYFEVQGVPCRSNGTSLQSNLRDLGWETTPLFRTNKGGRFLTWIVKAETLPGREVLRTAQGLTLKFKRVPRCPLEPFQTSGTPPLSDSFRDPAPAASAGSETPQLPSLAVLSRQHGSAMAEKILAGLHLLGDRSGSGRKALAGGLTITAVDHPEDASVMDVDADSTEEVVSEPSDALPEGDTPHPTRPPRSDAEQPEALVAAVSHVVTISEQLRSSYREAVERTQEDLVSGFRSITEGMNAKFAHLTADIRAQSEALANTRSELAAGLHRHGTNLESSHQRLSEAVRQQSVSLEATQDQLATVSTRVHDKDRRTKIVTRRRARDTTPDHVDVPCHPHQPDASASPSVGRAEPPRQQGDATPAPPAPPSLAQQPPCPPTSLPPTSDTSAVRTGNGGAADALEPTQGQHDKDRRAKTASTRERARDTTPDRVAEPDCPHQLDASAPPSAGRPEPLLQEQHAPSTPPSTTPPPPDQQPPCSQGQPDKDRRAKPRRRPLAEPQTKPTSEAQDTPLPQAEPPHAAAPQCGNQATAAPAHTAPAPRAVGGGRGATRMVYPPPRSHSADLPRARGAGQPPPNGPLPPDTLSRPGATPLPTGPSIPDHLGFDGSPSEGSPPLLSQH